MLAELRSIDWEACTEAHMGYSVAFPSSCGNENGKQSYYKIKLLLGKGKTRMAEYYTNDLISLEKTNIDLPSKNALVKLYDDNQMRISSFDHPHYTINHFGRISNRDDGKVVPEKEVLQHGEELLAPMVDYVHSRMEKQLNFIQQYIPDMSASPRCVFYSSRNYSVADKLLVFVSTLEPGIWSRSLLMKYGVEIGSMIPYFQKAIENNYGVIVMNPSMNTEANSDGLKVSIEGSSTQEEHVQNVWEKYIFPSAAHKINFITYGYGGVLVTNLIRNNCHDFSKRLGGICFIESSHRIDEKGDSCFKKFFSQHCVSWEASQHPLGTELTDNNQTGCATISAGPRKGSSSRNAAYTVQAVMDSAFRFFVFQNAYEFVRSETRRAQTPSKSRVLMSENCTTNDVHYDSLTIDDFHLMKVVGRGAFGKVMLVKKKTGSNCDKFYAMKVLKKAAVIAKKQVEHTKAERRILQAIDHPFIVRLRYAFQNENKLYFVTDYFAGGTLFFHLKKHRQFPESIAKYFAAQLILGIGHLHSLQIAYRDLKPENILMDDKGYIALTDFGLSRDNVDIKKARTFCGTPEYLAPETIKRKPYGKAVDWWSLGVIIYELLSSNTPFYHPNQKRNFDNIVKKEVEFPSYFSQSVKSLLQGLLVRDPTKRLGSGPQGPTEIMDHPFFADIDWEKLYKKQTASPFQPNVASEDDIKNVPMAFRREIAKDSVVTEKLSSLASKEFDGFSYTDSIEV